MYKKQRGLTSILFSVLFSALFLVSCASKKDVVYFQNAGNFETLVSKNNFATKFKVDDVVSINVSTFDTQASAPFNLYNVGPVENKNNSQMQQLDYLVDDNGEIDFPVIGKIKIVGLSQEELRVLLQQKLAEYLKDPIINIRLRNFTVTVLGAVAKPGTYQVNGEQITILEALGFAGDLTIKAVRDNIMVIRDFDGTKVYTRINLLDKNAMNSPVYYLTQNDVVYVEPNKSGITASSLDNRATIAISIASILITSTVIILTNQ